MSLQDEVADKLALEVIAAAEMLGDDSVITEIARVIGASSTTTQEAFMTMVRVRLSERRARVALAERLAKGRTGTGTQSGGKILDIMDDNGH